MFFTLHPGSSPVRVYLYFFSTISQTKSNWFISEMCSLGIRESRKEDGMSSSSANILSSGSGVNRRRPNNPAGRNVYVIKDRSGAYVYWCVQGGFLFLSAQIKVLIMVHQSITWIINVIPIKHYRRKRREWEKREQEQYKRCRKYRSFPFFLLKPTLSRLCSFRLRVKFFSCSNNQNTCFVQ